MEHAIDVEEAFRTHHGPLFRYLARLVGDADLAADAAQEAFVTMIERPPKETDHLKAWLYKVGTNAALSSNRTERRRRDLAHATVHRISPEEEEAVDQAVVDRLEAQRIKSALDRLGDRDRTVLLMRDEGFSHREIAQTVGTTTGSVGTLVARALDKVVSALNQDGKAST